MKNKTIMKKSELKKIIREELLKEDEKDKAIKKLRKEFLSKFKQYNPESPTWSYDDSYDMELSLDPEGKKPLLQYLKKQKNFEIVDEEESLSDDDPSENFYFIAIKYK